MGKVQVDSEGLSAGAARCGAWAAELADCAVLEGVGSAGTASAAAVNAGDAGAASAGEAMAARMRATAAKMVASSNTYVNTDRSSATNVNAVADCVQV